MWVSTQMYELSHQHSPTAEYLATLSATYFNARLHCTVSEAHTQACCNNTNLTCMVLQAVFPLSPRDKGCSSLNTSGSYMQSCGLHGISSGLGSNLNGLQLAGTSSASAQPSLDPLPTKVCWDYLCVVRSFVDIYSTVFLSETSKDTHFKQHNYHVTQVISVSSLLRFTYLDGMSCCSS